MFCNVFYFFFRLGASHVCLTMSPDGDLLVYKNKGRPNAEEREVMKSSDKLREELERLKKEMGYDDNTEIVLSISLASDEMIRHVHMFPEVFFIDVTANTNRQRRDLLVLVVRDATGECYPGNSTILPSGQSWIFQKVIGKFFRDLYGDVTISRNRLILTDDDPALHGPIDNLINTSPVWKKSKHMLCIFHAIVKAFHEQIYPLLPATVTGRKRKLTQRGRDYCKTFILLLHVCVCSASVSVVSPCLFNFPSKLKVPYEIMSSVNSFVCILIIRDILFYLIMSVK